MLVAAAATGAWSASNALSTLTRTPGAAASDVAAARAEMASAAVAATPKRFNNMCTSVLISDPRGRSEPLSSAQRVSSTHDAQGGAPRVAHLDAAGHRLRRVPRRVHAVAHGGHVGVGGQLHGPVPQADGARRWAVDALALPGVDAEVV